MSQTGSTAAPTPPSDRLHLSPPSPCSNFLRADEKKIACTLDEAANSQHLSPVLVEAFKILQATRDEGDKALQLFRIGGVIASRPTLPRARELKREFSASDKAVVRQILQLLPG